MTRPLYALVQLRTVIAILRPVMNRTLYAAVVTALLIILAVAMLLRPPPPATELLLLIRQRVI